MSNRMWTRFASRTLGFSIQYPTTFRVVYGDSTEPDAVSFIHTSQDGNIDASIQVNVDGTSDANSSEEVNPDLPHTQIILAGLPAEEEEAGNASCPNCLVRFILINQGYRYMINIGTALRSPELSSNDIDYIRRSFLLLN